METFARMVGFRCIGWFYKCNFWILREISDRPMCSEKFLGFFSMRKTFSKIFFRWFLKIFGKSQNSIRIWMIPFITRYTGNHQNPYRIWGFSKKFQKNSNIFKNIFFEKIFSSRKKILGIFLNTYVNPKFSKDSKNHT